VSAGGGEITVEAAVTADPELYGAVVRLLPQLSGSAAPPTAYDLETIIESPATTLFVARDRAARIVGMLTLAVFKAPSGVRAWIEDVVVDAAVRHQGVGGALVEAALVTARRAEARTVDLTSRPDRADANRLYEHLGFDRRETNVYRLTLR
jgi:ribosomal protein S18 acetylase RimI-like enzyme